MTKPSAWMHEDGKHFWWLHECDSEGGRWAVKVGFKPETMLPLGASGWTVVSKDPLTVTPSILCHKCKVHGWIRNGEWEEA